MNTKNLIDAFGEINAEELKKTTRPEEKLQGEYQAPVFVSPQKQKRSKKPVIAAASGLAACAVLAFGLSVGFKSVADSPLSDTDSIASSTEYDTAKQQYGGEAAEPEILDGRSLYSVSTEEIYRRDNQAHTEHTHALEETGGLDSIYSNEFYGGGRVYLEGSDFYFTTEKPGRITGTENPPPYPEEYRKAPAEIFLYNVKTRGTKLILEESPEDEEWGLLLKIAGIYDGKLYYYKVQRPMKAEDYKEIIGLWNVDLQSGEKKELFSMETNCCYYLQPVTKSGEYIYFADYGIVDENKEEWENNSRIYRFSMQTQETELFIDKVKRPLLCPYKDGIVYYSPESYYLYQNEDGKKVLFPDNFMGKINTFGGDNIMYAYRTVEGDEQKTVLGIFGENFVKRDLGIFPTGAKINPETQTSFFGVGAVNDNFITGGDSGLVYISIQYGNNILIYDRNKDCFSKIALSEDQEVICCSKTEEGLAFIIAQTEIINGARSRDYKSISYFTINR